MKNRRYYAAYSILKKAMPIWFVYLLFLLSRGLTYTEAILLDSFTAAVSIILEIPSGILADRMSKKRLIIVGEITILSNFIFLMIFNHYILYVIGALLNGVGEAFISGTGEALIYDSFLCEKQENEYKQYIGNVNKWAFIIIAVMTLSSSYMFDQWNDLPMIVSIILHIGSMCSLLFFSEKTIHCEQIKEEKSWRSGLQEQKDIIKDLLHKKELMVIFSLCIVMKEIISTINYSTQAFLPSIGLDVKFLGAILFVFNLCSALGAKYSGKMKANGSIWIGFYVVILCLLATGNIYVAIASLAASRFVNGFIWIVLSDEVNKRIESQDRSTILSYQNLGMEVFPLFIDPLIAVLYDIKGFEYTYVVVAVCLGLMLGVVRRVKKKKHRGNYDT